MPPSDERLLTTGEVAALFRVSPKTVTRWANEGRVRAVRTPGGHRRIFESSVRRFLGPAADREPTPGSPAAPNVQPAEHGK